MVEVIKLNDIIKWGSIYWFNKRIPADLQDHFGGKEKMTCSLKTKDMKAAQKKAQDIRNE